VDKVKTLSDTKFEILSSESCRNRHFQIGGRYLQVSCSAVTATGGRAVPQAVSRRPVAAEGRVQSQGSPCGICG